MFFLYIFHADDSMYYLDSIRMTQDGQIVCFKVNTNSNFSQNSVQKVYGLDYEQQGHTIHRFTLHQASL